MLNPESADRISAADLDLPASGASLLALDDGAAAEVVTIDGDSAILDQLIGHGIVDGARIRVESRLPLGGPILVRVGRARIAVPRVLAAHVRVRSVAP